MELVLRECLCSRMILSSHANNASVSHSNFGAYIWMLMVSKLIFYHFQNLMRQSFYLFSFNFMPLILCLLVLLFFLLFYIMKVLKPFSQTNLKCWSFQVSFMRQMIVTEFDVGWGDGRCLLMVFITNYNFT